MTFSLYGEWYGSHDDSTLAHLYSPPPPPRPPMGLYRMLLDFDYTHANQRQPETIPDSVSDVIPLISLQLKPSAVRYLSSSPVQCLAVTFCIIIVIVASQIWLFSCETERFEYQLSWCTIRPVSFVCSFVPCQIAELTYRPGRGSGGGGCTLSLTLCRQCCLLLSLSKSCVARLHIPGQLRTRCRSKANSSRL